MNQQQTVRLLAALANPVRLDIIALLRRRGRLSVGQIVGHFDMSQPAISHHLRVLKDAGVVHSEKMGQEVYYRCLRDKIAADLHAIARSLE